MNRARRIDSEGRSGRTGRLRAAVPDVASRVGDRALVWLPLALAAALALVVWAEHGGTARTAALPTVKAGRGTVTVTVGGVGRIVTTGTSGQIDVPASSSASSTGGSGGAPATSSATTSAPADAVFPRASGQVSKLLVQPGQRVAAGQPLAVLDDGGVAASAVLQARIDVSSGELELRQKETSDPSKGRPPTPMELAAARLAVVAAHARLGQVLGPPPAADVATARQDVTRAQADLEVLLGGSPAARRDALAVAQSGLDAAQRKLERVLAPASPADLAAAQADVRKAESDLATLMRPAPGPLPEDVTAAEFAVTVAQQGLSDAQALTPPDPSAVGTAQLELDRAEAALAALLQPAQAPLPTEIASAQAAVDAARLRLAALQAPPDPSDVAAARADVRRAQAEVRTLQAGLSPVGLAAARQAVAAAHARLRRVLGPPRPADVAAARRDLGRSEADLGVLRARGGPASATDISLARLRLEAARSRLAAARKTQAALTVRASSAGTVTSLMTSAGAPVDAATPVATVVDLDRLAVSVQLSEFDVARVANGQKAVVRVDALGGRAFHGTVAFTALSGIDNGGVVTFPVTVSLPHAAGARPGMNVSVRIVVAQARNVVEVPLEAIAHDGQDRTVVSVVDGSGKTSSRPVTLGLSNNKSVAVVKGLKAGERVTLAASGGPE